MLIYSILNTYKKNLNLGKTDENIDLSMRTITEFKKHNVTIEDLKEETTKTEDEYLKKQIKRYVVYI